MIVQFTVHGQPVTQGSMRALISRSTGRAIVVPSASLKPWRASVAWAARQAYTGEPVEGAVVLVADFYVRRPKGLPKRFTHAIKKPDLDKCLRAILDACTSILWVDDSQVTSITATKSYGEPRVEVFAKG